MKLSRFTTIGIGGKARLYVKPPTLSKLREAFLFAIDNGLPYFVLGNGSDVLFSDTGFDGLVIHTPKLSDFYFDRTNLIASCGAKLPKLIRESIKFGLSGLENLIGIPGTIGGAVAKNAGAFGREIAELINWIEYLSPDGKIVRKAEHELKFGYRWSEFPENGIILRVALKLSPSKPEKIEKLSKQFLTKRKKTQPVGRTAGCVFKNPEGGESAGYLLDRAGMKGVKIGGAKYSEIHANFIVNFDRATAFDVVQLMRLGKKRVWELFRTNLEPEIVMVGVKL